MRLAKGKGDKREDTEAYTAVGNPTNLALAPGSGC
jgi:hypothetical protein